MKPSIAKQITSLNIVIYAKNGILAGDFAALLSGHNTVDRQTSLPGLIKSINSNVDLLLLVGGGTTTNPSELSPVLTVAEKFGVKVIILGKWSGLKETQPSKSLSDSVIILEEIPSPLALFEIIGSTTNRSN